ncbi:fimbrial protein [Halomonas huangheensis]|nr:fimbrial protein [Halomonas huangheensis]
MLGISLAAQLALPTPAYATRTDNCTASSLPWSPVLYARITKDLPIGSVIPGSTISNTVSIDCTSDWSNDNVWGDTCNGGPNWALSEASETLIRETSRPGVYTFDGLPEYLGYQFMSSSGQPLSLDSEGRHNTGVRIATGQQSVPLDFRLIKISDTTATSTSAELRMYLSCNGNEWGNRNAAGSLVTLHVDIEQITQTCSMVIANTQVVLPTVSSSAFNGVGSAAGSTPFTLEFDCDADAAAKVNISDATTPSNATDILTLQNDSSADGLGVRLTHQGTPVRLAPNQAFDLGGSEFPLDSPGGSQIISLPLAAEYVQKDASVTPGTVQALAVVTIAYD